MIIIFPSQEPPQFLNPTLSLSDQESCFQSISQNQIQLCLQSNYIRYASVFEIRFQYIGKCVIDLILKFKQMSNLQTSLSRLARPRIQTLVQPPLRRTLEPPLNDFQNSNYQGLDTMTYQLLQSPRIRTTSFELESPRFSAPCVSMHSSSVLDELPLPKPLNRTSDYASKIRQLTSQWEPISDLKKSITEDRLPFRSVIEMNGGDGLGKAKVLDGWNTASPINRELKENYLDSYSFKKQKGSHQQPRKELQKEKKYFHTPREQTNFEYESKNQDRACFTSYGRFSLQQEQKANIRVSEFNFGQPSEESLEFVRGSLIGKARPKPQLLKPLRTNFLPKRLSIRNFQIGPCKGDGKFGKVYPCRNLQTKTLYALKQIPKNVIKKNNLQNQLVWEVKLQSFFKHPNIVKLYGFFDDATNIYLLMEYMEGGTLFDYLKKHKAKGGLPEVEVSKRMKEICSAVYYLHDMEIAHRDIKPENIVLSNGVAKLCDFGWATLANQRRTTYCGTFDYSSPEMLEGKDYDSSVDLWSLGVLAYELLTGKLPFYSISRKETMKNILSVDKSNINFPPETSWEARSFIQGLLKKQPDQRREADMLLQHPFLKKYQQNFI